MNNKSKNRYRLCIKFASFFNSEFRYDIVHDSWLYYLDKTGKDLFMIDLQNESSFLYTVIKRGYFRWHYKERIGDKYFYLPTDVLKGDFNPYESLVGKNLYEIFYNKLYNETKPNDNRHYRTNIARQLPLDIFRLKADGYTQQEISDTLNVSKQLVNHYNKKIKDLNVNFK